MPPPPEELLRSLIEGPSMVSDIEYHATVSSTNTRAAEAAQRGVAEGYLVLADRQTAGRGRLGRRWEAPADSSLLLSVVLRPAVDAELVSLVPLLAGLALAEVVDSYCPDHAVGLKWPNDLLVDDAKVAGILLERVEDTSLEAGIPVVVGIGVNVDWRGVDRGDLTGSTSLAEVVGARVDRWRVLAGLIGVFGRRYAAWQEAPMAFVPAYRERCVTLGRRIRVDEPGSRVITGHAASVADDGRLCVHTEAGATECLASGDVTHVRDA